MTLPLMDQRALSKLKRHDLQHIARREGLKANAKNLDLIGTLISKYPDGVPRHQTSDSSKGKPVSRVSNRIKAEPRDLDPSMLANRQPKRQRTDAGPSSSRISPPNTPRRSQIFTVDWIDSVAVAPAPPGSEPARELSPPPVPGYKDVRFVRRELVRLVNNSVDIRAEVDQTNKLLKHAVSIYNNNAIEFREMVCIRETMETSLVARMKADRTIWDGMFNMENEEDQDNWENYVKDMEEYRAKQKEIKKKEKDAKLAAEFAAHERQSAAARKQLPRTAGVTLPEEPLVGSKRKRGLDEP